MYIPLQVRHVRHHIDWTPRVKREGLTLKQLDHFLKFNLFSNAFPYKCNISVWNWSSTMNIELALRILIRASVATMLCKHPCLPLKTLRIVWMSDWNLWSLCGCFQWNQLMIIEGIVESCDNCMDNCNKISTYTYHNYLDKWLKSVVTVWTIDWKLLAEL